MNKLIILIGTLVGTSCQTDGTRVDYTEKIQIAQSIDNVQDMKEWMLEDISQGVIDTAYGEYYMKWLNETEDLLIEMANTK